MSTISARINRILAQQIIDGTLKPGEKLEERSLAARFEVSRTPIREALRELGARGLVEIKPRSGVVVAQIGIDRLSTLLEADCELEALCARRAAQCMTSMEKKELEFLHEQSEKFVAERNDENYLISNSQFHALICAGARNDVLAGMVEDLRQRLAPFRQAQNEIEDRFAVSHMEHGAVVDAILSGNSEAAYLAMRGHNARISSTVIRLIKRRAEDKQPA